MKRGATGSLWGGFTTTTIVVVVEFYYENVVLCICDKNTISHTIAQSLRWMSTEPSQSQPIQVEWEPENTTTNNLKRHYISLHCTSTQNRLCKNKFISRILYVCVCVCVYILASAFEINAKMQILQDFHGFDEHIVCCSLWRVACQHVELVCWRCILFYFFLTFF